MFKATLTTTNNYLHATSISLFQHHTAGDEGIGCYIVVLGGGAGSRIVGNQSHYYSDVPSVISNMKEPLVSACATSLGTNNVEQMCKNRGCDLIIQDALCKSQLKESREIHPGCKPRKPAALLRSNNFTHSPASNLPHCPDIDNEQTLHRCVQESIYIYIYYIYIYIYISFYRYGIHACIQYLK